MSPPPPGFDTVNTADGSMMYRGPSWVRRRLESNQVRLVVVRHGQSESNAAQGVLLYGQSESPLTQHGIEQARSCAQLLYAQLGGDEWLKTCVDTPQKLPVFLSSPLSRARDSAIILRDHLRQEILSQYGEQTLQRLNPYLEVQTDRRLAETHFGRYERRDLEDLTRDYPKFVHDWRPPEGMGTDFLHRFPGGESRADVMRRTGSFLNGLAHTQPGRTVILMSHSECILGVRTALGMAPVQDGRVRAETSAIGNARPYWLVGAPDREVPMPATELQQKIY